MVIIDVLDILAVNDVPAYGLVNDSFYILGARNKPKKIDKEKQIRVFSCATGAENYRMRLELERKREEMGYCFDFSFFNDFKLLLMNGLLFLKNQKLLFSGYFALVFINIFALVKFNKNKFSRT